MKISFLTLFGCVVKIALDFNPIYGKIDRPCSKGPPQLIKLARCSFLMK